MDFCIGSKSNIKNRKIEKILRLIMLISIICFSTFAGWAFANMTAWNKAGDYYEHKWNTECLLPRQYPREQWNFGQEYYEEYIKGWQYNSTNTTNTSENYGR
jgi:hypothetical protein